MSSKPSVLLAGNWKMNHGPKATREFLTKLELPKKERAQARLYVPTLSLTSALAGALERALPVQIGAQNVHYEKSGAFTGEISGPMLSEIGINQALIGHSERRQFFGETNESVLLKTKSALEQGFEVLLCVGELLSERESGKTESVLREQLIRVLENQECKTHFGGRLHLAYEPVWAIGTGVVATPEQAQSAHAYIRSLLANALGEQKARDTKILYGGSVTPANFKELLSCPGIDGGLVGGASLKPESFRALWDLI
jgi:triosephosphate isomerase